MLISLGKYLNHLARPNVVIATNPAAKAGFPYANLKDGTPTKIFKFGIVPQAGIDGGTLNRTGTIDLCLLKNPGAESGLSGWKKGGTVVATTAQKNSGAKSWQIAADGYLYQDVLVRSGERLRISGATRGDGVAANAYFGVLDITTGLALDSNGEWVTPDTSVGTGTSTVGSIKKLGAQTTAAWLATSREFNAQAYSATQKHLTTLRIVAAVSGSGNGFVDDLVLIPGTDWCSIHGFNFPANMLVTVESADSNSWPGTARFSLTPFQPSFHQRLEGVFCARWLKFTLLGVRERQFLPFIGELIFTQSVHLEISAKYASALHAEWLNTDKLKTPALADKALATPARPVRSLNLPFRWVTESQYDQAREWFINRSRGSTEEILIAEPKIDREAIIYGRLGGGRGFSIQAPDVRDSEAVQITEKELPKPPKGEEI